MSFELIGDGLHIAPQTIEMAAKFKKPLCVSLTTDAMRAAGQNVTESYLGEKLPENRVIIEGGVAKLPDRSSFGRKYRNHGGGVQKCVPQHKTSD